MRDAIAHSLNTLNDLGTGKFTQSNAALLMQVLEKYLGVYAIKAALHGPVVNLTEAFYTAGIMEAGKNINMDISLNQADLKAIEVLKSANLHWIGNSWDAYTSEKLNGALSDYYKEGYTRQQLTERFAKDFAGLAKRSSHYWELLADHTATKTREIGRIGAYQSAKVKYIQVRARMDKRTSRVCQKMHGKIIQLSHLSKQRDSYLEAAKNKDLEAAKAAWKMWQDKDNLNQLDGKLPSNIGLPPYHFRCRTITVAYFD